MDTATLTSFPPATTPDYDPFEADEDNRPIEALSAEVDRLLAQLPRAA